MQENFSDVVNWLKANAVEEDCFSTLASQVPRRKLVSESKDNGIGSFQVKTSFAQACMIASFTPSWNLEFSFAIKCLFNMVGKLFGS